MRTRRFTLALVAILAALAALAACGGEDGGLGNRSLGDESTNDDQTSDDESSNDDESSDDTSSDDTSSDDTEGESSDDTSQDDTDADDDSSSGGASSEFCSLYNTYTEGASDIVLGEASPDELRELYEEFDEIAGPLADSAPDEVSDDVNTLVDVGATMGDVLAEHDYDVTEAMSDPALSDAFNQDFLDATENVDDYVAANC